MKVCQSSLESNVFIFVVVKKQQLQPNLVLSIDQNGEWNMTVLPILSETLIYTQVHVCVWSRFLGGFSINNLLVCFSKIGEGYILLNCIIPFCHCA